MCRRRFAFEHRAISLITFDEGLDPGQRPCPDFSSVIAGIAGEHVTATADLEQGVACASLSSQVAAHIAAGHCFIATLVALQGMVFAAGQCNIATLVAPCRAS